MNSTYLVVYSLTFATNSLSRPPNGPWSRLLSPRNTKVSWICLCNAGFCSFFPSHNWHVIFKLSKTSPKHRTSSFRETFVHQFRFCILLQRWHVGGAFGEQVDWWASAVTSITFALTHWHAKNLGSETIVSAPNPNLEIGRTEISNMHQTLKRSWGGKHSE